MALLSSTRLPPGLFLCLALLLASATSQSTNDRCPFFTNNNTINGPPINTNPEVYQRNKLYTVKVPVDYNVTFVVLRALDKMNNLVGNWQKTSQGVPGCQGSGNYSKETFKDTILTASWLSPNSLNITTVQLQAITVRANTNAMYASLTLNESEKTSTPTSKTPEKTSTPTSKTPEKTSSPTSKTPEKTSSPTSKTPEKTSTPTSKTSAKTSSSTSKTPARTSTPTTSRASIYHSPITDALEILLAFLISRLLF
ncbi:PREDICTED: placenta-expressed transcript 1 protein [Elephantulus edwardii]|uniref:placenta-expressed transcript 1 protein n=1 Tax=Elephantulus edwardii TaxID=28737 RepID=UPI0003F09C79|nr:PREDICTED: placenta-expressed transcript 1 protein [Elephantulus edwardii]